MGKFVIKYILLAEVAFWISAVLLAKLLLPFGFLIRALQLQETPAPSDFKNLHSSEFLPAKSRKIAGYLEKMGRIVSKNKPCLTNALAGHIMFRVRGTDTILYLGVTIQSKSKILAHAWLTTDSGVMIVGANSMSDYKPLAMFKRIKK